MDCGQNFEKIKCKYKVGVDPAIGEYSRANPTYTMTSDEFLSKIKKCLILYLSMD